MKKIKNFVLIALTVCEMHCYGMTNNTQNQQPKNSFFGNIATHFKQALPSIRTYGPIVTANLVALLWTMQRTAGSWTKKMLTIPKSKDNRSFKVTEDGVEIGKHKIPSDFFYGNGDMEKVEFKDEFGDAEFVTVHKNGVEIGTFCLLPGAQKFWAAWKKNDHFDRRFIPESLTAKISSFDGKLGLAKKE